MALYPTTVKIIHPITNQLVRVQIWVDAPNPRFAETVSQALNEMIAFVGNASTLRATAAQLIEDIDSQGETE